LNQVHILGNELGAVVGGMLDVVFAFSLALERKGLLARSEIVDTLSQVQQQIAAQEGPASKRGAVAELMLAAFATPRAGEQARARFRVVDGGGC
jgi:hypothetical protein